MQALVELYGTPNTREVIRKLTEETEAMEDEDYRIDLLTLCFQTFVCR